MTLPICERLVLTPDCDVAALRDNGVEAAELIRELFDALGDLLFATQPQFGHGRIFLGEAQERASRALAKARGEA
jgi:hypothetical protein